MDKIIKLAGIIILFSLFCIFLNFKECLAGSITLRIVAVNPADSEQSVPVKVYMPMEVKPEDVIYKEDLEVAYDTQQGSYYVSGEYLLKPKEVLEKEIEIRDIWVIEPAQIASLRQENKEIVEQFKKTNLSDRANILSQSVEKKLGDVEDLQKSSAISPGYKISNYRNSLSLLNSAKADLLAAKTLLSEVSPKGFNKLTWRIILFIIIFLGILGLGFYIIWQQQAKLEVSQKPKENDPTI